jgi:predicted RNase H-like nuclease (RuvC/YqgF family)
LKYYIVGIDPGNTIGLAFLDLEGKINKVCSFSGSINDVIKIIEQTGTPTIIATDVNPAPDLAIRIASYFNCRLFVPKIQVREYQKWKLIREYEKKEKRRLINNLHERDALASTIIAYREVQNTIRSALVDTKIENSKKEKYAHLIVQGYSAKTAFEIVNQKEVLEKIQPKENKINKEQPILKNEFLNNEIIKLEKENIQLKKRIEFLEQENQKLQEYVNNLKKDFYLKILKDKEIKKLKNKVLILKRLLSFISKKNKPSKQKFLENLKKDNKKEDETKEKQKKNEQDKEQKNQNQQLKTKTNVLKELDTNKIIQIIQEHRKRMLTNQRGESDGRE